MRLELGNVVKFTDDIVKIEKLIALGYKKVEDDTKVAKDNKKDDKEPVDKKDEK